MYHIYHPAATILKENTKGILSFILVIHYTRLRNILRSLLYSFLLGGNATTAVSVQYAG